MNLTNLNLVRNHLYRLNLGEGEIRNNSFRLSSEKYSTLPHSRVISASESVKAVENTIPLLETIVLGDDPVLLSHSQLVLDTIVCADNSSLSMLYQENVDYTIDYAAGSVKRISSGSIDSGAEVTLWYLFYHIYQRGVDYYFDYERGRLRRITSGSIEEGQEITVDYRLGSTEFSDSEIDQCIIEAESEIVHLIDQTYRDSLDPALQTAATCLALSLLCRNSAGITAAGVEGTNKISSVWIELEQSYRETAYRLLTWFRGESPGLNPPKLV
jgi:hypothetical protein